MVAAKTDLAFDANLTASGSDLELSATLSEYGQVWDRPGTNVQVELFQPDGGIQTIMLRESAPGLFETTLSNQRAGAYTAHFIATGKSLLGQRVFQRECLRSIAIFSVS